MVSLHPFTRSNPKKRDTCISHSWSLCLSFYLGIYKVSTKSRAADGQKSVIRPVDVLAYVLTDHSPGVIGSQNEFLHRQMCISMCR